jgi:hypothetical protein
MAMWVEKDIYTNKLCYKSIVREYSEVLCIFASMQHIVFTSPHKMLVTQKEHRHN